MKIGSFLFLRWFFFARALCMPRHRLGSVWGHALICFANEVFPPTKLLLLLKPFFPPPHRKLYTQVNRRGKSWVTKAGERREGGRREQTSCPHSPPLIKSCRREWGTENRRKGGRTKTRREGYNIPRIILLSLLFALRYTSWYGVKNLRHPP